MRPFTSTTEATTIAAERQPTTHEPASTSTIVLFTLGIVLFWAAMYVYTPVFPVYAGVLGASMTTVGLAVGAYGLTQMLLRIPLGIWSDALGKRRAFVVIGMVICGLAAVGFAFSPSPAWLVIFRGVMGISAATWVCSTILFTSYFPGRHPSIPLSIMTFASASGQLLGVSTGGEIAQRLGWIAPFWASVILSVLGALVLFRVPEDVTARAMPISREGMVRTARSRSLILACLLGVVMQYVAWSTINGFTPVLAAERFAATRSQLGYLTTTGLLAYVVITLFTPRLVARIGEAPTLALSLALLAAGILPTPWVNSLGGLAVLQVINGVGRGFLYPLLLSLSIKTTAPQDRASAMGVFQATYGFGMFVGPSFSGGIAEAFGLDAVFILCGLLCVASLPLVAWSARRVIAR
jgi:MFS family permease